MFTKPPGRRASERGLKVGPATAVLTETRNLISASCRVIFRGSHEKPQNRVPVKGSGFGVWLFFENSTGC
jgi:hypothetical protein